MEQLHKSWVTQFLRREWQPTDGLPSSVVDAAEQRLDCALPAALRSFYVTLGNNAIICASHNQIFATAALAFTDDYLLFMDENQSVVSWGIRRADLALADPPTWQRNNTEPVEWFAEDKTFNELLASMFAWYAEADLWPGS